MNEIVVISGKGGTGKTSLTAAFAQIAGDSIIVADCDVDAADMHLLMAPDFANKQEFRAGLKAIIDPDKCTGCGECAERCRFDAIFQDQDIYKIDELSCEGCGYCHRVCKYEAINLFEPVSGHFYESTIKTNTKMVHAHLSIGADNSGKLVTKVKNEARKLATKLKKETILVDGSPGIGCPVVSSLSGATCVVLVTEPTVSGIHDLSRVHQLIKTFNLPSVCIINKSDLNIEVSERIKAFLQENEIPLLAEIEYNDIFSRAITAGKTIIEMGDSEMSQKLFRVWEQITVTTN